MIMEVDAKIDHDHMLNAFRQSAAEVMVYRQQELLLDKRFVAADEQAILSHNLLTNKIPNTHKTALSSVNAVESKAIDTEFNELQRLKTLDRVNISPHRLS